MIDRVLQRGAVRAHAVDLGHLCGVLADHRSRPGVGEHVAGLLGRVRVVDRHDDRAGREGGAVRERPVQARASEDGNRVARTDAERDEPACQVADAPAELAPRRASVRRRGRSSAPGREGAPSRRAPSRRGTSWPRARSPAWAAVGLAGSCRDAAPPRRGWHPPKATPRAAVGRGWQASTRHLASAIPPRRSRRDPSGPPRHPSSARRPDRRGRRVAVALAHRPRRRLVPVADDHDGPRRGVLARPAPRRRPLRPERARAHPARGPGPAAEPAGPRARPRPGAAPGHPHALGLGLRRHRRGPAPAADRRDDRRRGRAVREDDGQDRPGADRPDRRPDRARARARVRHGAAVHRPGHEDPRRPRRPAGRRAGAPAAVPRPAAPAAGARRGLRAHGRRRRDGVLRPRPHGAPGQGPGRRRHRRHRRHDGRPGPRRRLRAVHVPPLALRAAGRHLRPRRRPRGRDGRRARWAARSSSAAPR